MTSLQRDYTGAHQVSQARALLFLEQAVDLAQRLHHRVAQPLRRARAGLGRLGRALLVEASAGDRVGQRGDAAPLVDLRLRPLALRAVGQGGRRAPLLRVECEFGGRDPPGGAPAEAPAAAVAAVLVATKAPAALAAAGTVAMLLRPLAALLGGATGR